MHDFYDRVVHLLLYQILSHIFPQLLQRLPQNLGLADEPNTHIPFELLPETLRSWGEHDFGLLNHIDAELHIVHEHALLLKSYKRYCPSRWLDPGTCITVLADE